MSGEEFIPAEIGNVRRSGGFDWRLVAIDGDRLTVEAVGYGFTREWTMEDWLPMRVDMDPVDDVPEEDES